MRRRRPVWILVTTAISVVSAGIGFAAATMVRSPADVAASASAPPPTLITAAVQYGVVERTLITRGELAAQSLLGIGPGGLSAGDSLEPGSGEGVLTRVTVKKDQPVKSGTVVAEVSGRPIVVFKGARASYRDLRPGMSGPDVRQLQQELRKLGFSLGGDRQGTFGAGTGKAVSRFYDSIGYEPLGTDGGSGEDALRVSDAKRGVLQAQDSLQALLDRRREVQACRAAPQPEEPVSCDSPPRATEIKAARSELSGARQHLGRVRETVGVMVPRGEVAFVPKLPQRVAEVARGVGLAAPADVAAITGSKPLVEASVPAGSAENITTGTRVTMGDGDGDGDVVGEVVDVAVAEDPQDGYTVTIDAGDALEKAALGSDVRVVFVLASTATPVLSVPLGAISSDASGAAYVNRLEADGSTSRIPVRIGVVGNDSVEVQVGSDELGRASTVVLGP